MYQSLVSAKISFVLRVGEKDQEYHNLNKKMGKMPFTKGITVFKYFIFGNISSDIRSKI